jgi:hypothetical protein
MKPILGTCSLESGPHPKTCGCIDWQPLPPKKKWWQQALDGLGNAIGESLFGGGR